MNLERKLLIPREKELLLNGDNWVPPTPEKSMMQRSGFVPADTRQNPISSESWQDLLGIYTGLLQDETSNRLSGEFSAHDQKGPSHGELTKEAAPVQNYSGLPQSFTSGSLESFGCMGLNNVEHTMQNLNSVRACNQLPQNQQENTAPVNTMRYFSQEKGSIGLRMQNAGCVTAHKVVSLAEFMGTDTQQPTTLANGMPCRGANIMGNPTIFNTHSHVESHWQTVNLNSSTPQKIPVFAGRRRCHSHILQQELNTADAMSSPHQADCIPKAHQILHGEYSYLTTPIQFEPTTPDQRNQIQKPVMDASPFLVSDTSSYQEKNEKDNLVFDQPNKKFEQMRSELDSSLGISDILTSSKENINSYDGNGEIDLNKTPQQKPSRRKKHRPKVAGEGSRKRTPKTEATRENSTNKLPVGKKNRNYRKKTDTSTPFSTVTNEFPASNIESTVKSCRRSLKFDFESEVERVREETGVSTQKQNTEISKVSFDLNSGPLSSAKAKELSSASSITTGYTKESVYKLNDSENHIPLQEVIPVAPAPPLVSSKDHSTLNLIARSVNARHSNGYENGCQNRCSQILMRPQYQVMSKKPVQPVIQANTNRTNIEKIRQFILQTRSQLPVDAAHISENQECRRIYSSSEQEQHQTVVLMGSLSSMGSSKRGHANNDSTKSQENSSETIKRRRIEDRFLGTSCSMSTWNTAVDDYSGERHSRGYMSYHDQSSVVYMNYGLRDADIKERRSSGNSICDLSFKLKDKQSFRQQETPAQIHSIVEQIEQNTSNQLTQVQNLAAHTALSNWILKSTNQRDYMTHGYQIMNTSCESTPISTTFSCINEVSRKYNKSPKGGEHPSKTATVSRVRRRKLSPIDLIIECMKDLHIYDNSMEVIQKDKHALVPYGGAGAIVSSEAFDPIKKRRPRPKVDLDPETNRVWNLLMNKEGESTEQIDNDREKWWEKERDVLRIRADSFIARMHLVQGDRRFSKWKGSVVDSVIGVFLTQNVSDHLSSSAFMALASKFPLKSKNKRETGFQAGINPSPEQQNVRVTYPDGTTSDHRMITSVVHNPSSVTSSDSFECEEEKKNARGTSYLIDDDRKRSEEDIISSQSSSESVIFQASEDIRSSSGSNSEAEDHITGWNFSKTHDTSSFSGQSEGITAFKTFQVMRSSYPNDRPLIGNQHVEDQLQGQPSDVIKDINVCDFPFSSNLVPKITIPLPMSDNPSIQRGALDKWETDVNLTYGTTVADGQDISEKYAESDMTAQQTGWPKHQASAANPGILDKHSEQNNVFLEASESRSGLDFSNGRNERRQETIQPESKFLTDHGVPIISFTNSSSENVKYSENITLKPVEMSQIHSSTASKQQVDKEKTEAFNWDALRKQVQSDIGERVRRWETLDSMDYEAVRNADVHEISEAIKERGMNNMLAERIKAFLNRMVTDHEKIDLEWLRDVQPDKVKDYLLSIRGLGLKSVECVRLLTLHNVAFPVDTNVGRIAVRLGWVPLRPLPESLQLHLLELYPVLESIQKYLWPRLCHLDQQTLYELHYQMITFGKVFCTKRDPNCNACPMRGDCRHFASAYASTRLALPGPQEQQIVCSTTQGSSIKGSEIITNSLPLLQADLKTENGLPPNNEPIIEEPTTPETTLELPENDIEDVCFEDPDEIPEIKLNMEEFTSNLQCLIQENKEMSEDLSKALVVLSPELASIPMPKLKHASKLRTEHQVYELPDSHPVLRGMDKREPDDPTPYLLVIQTPGDTISSLEESDSCNKNACYSSTTTSETDAQTAKCTILIPCRTAMRGSFPLNGTYFQVNEVFADHESSMNPIVVPTRLLWNLPRRTVFFGTSVTSIFKGLTTEAIQFCFWKGFVCVRGFCQETRAPRPLRYNFHHPASKMVKQNQQRS